MENIRRRSFVKRAGITGACLTAFPGMAFSGLKASEHENSGMVLHVLCAGGPTPTQNRWGSSLVLQLGKDFLMFDCGPAATYKLIKIGILPIQVDYLFFTHHHSDHDVDYPCFLLTRWDQDSGGMDTLKVFGPQPTEWITDHLVGDEGAFSYDWKARIGHPASQEVHITRGGSLPRPKPFINVKDIGTGSVVAKNDWAITAATAQHVQPWLESLAYRVDSKVGSIVIAGDSAPCETLENLATGADILVINCTDNQDVVDEKEWLGKVASGTLDAARLAEKCNVNKLILSHIGINLERPESKERGIGDIAKIYSGEIIFADELMSLKLI